MHPLDQGPNPQHCRLCLVRHGETPWNAERRLQGHLDVPLNGTGVAQAAATSRSLAAHRFAAIYCSDLRRARDTAAPAAALLGRELRCEPRLRERHYGVFQGLTYAEAEAQYRQEYAQFAARDPQFAFPGGGESLADFAARIAGVLATIAQRHLGEQVLVVTHGGVLDIAHRLATGAPLHLRRDFAIPNAALNWIDFNGDGWEVVAWADESHLAGARDELSNA